MDLADACQWADELFACHWAQQVEAEWAEAEHWAKDLADDFERSEVQTFARQVGLPKALKDEWRGDGPPKKPVTPGPLTGSKRQRFEQITGCKRRRGGSKYHQKLLARLHGTITATLTAVRGTITTTLALAVRGTITATLTAVRGTITATLAPAVRETSTTTLVPAVSGKKRARF